MKPGPNAGYSSSAYVKDLEYAISPGHYTRAYLLIQKDLEELFEFVEPSPESEKAFSYRIHELLMRTCIEVEANFKAILNENTYVPTVNHFGPIYNMGVYKKVNTTHHLSSYEVLLPIWNGPRRIWKPFQGWGQNTGIDWYQSYNASKHDRQQAFKEANLEMLISAVAGLLVLLSSQFQDDEFSAGSVMLSVRGYDYHELSPALGSLFRIAYPTDWPDDEMYDFNWSTLKNDPERFQKFDYNTV